MEANSQWKLRNMFNSVADPAKRSEGAERELEALARS